MALQWITMGWVVKERRVEGLYYFSLPPSLIWTFTGTAINNKLTLSDVRAKGFCRSNLISQESSVRAKDKGIMHMYIHRLQICTAAGYNLLCYCSIGTAVEELLQRKWRLEIDYNVQCNAPAPDSILCWDQLEITQLFLNETQPVCMCGELAGGLNM